MAKRRPKGHIPQQRIRTKETLPAASEVSTGQSEVDMEDTLQTLMELFEVQNATSGEPASTFLGSFLGGYDEIAASHGITIDPGEYIAFIPDFVVLIRDAIERLQEKGVDPVASHEKIPHPKVIEILRELMPNSIERLASADETFTAKMKSTDDEYDPEEVTEAIYMRLVQVYGASKRVAQGMFNNDALHVDDEHSGSGDVYDTIRSYRAKSLIALEREIANNPNTVRRETTKALRFIMSEEVTSFLEYLNYIESEPETITTPLEDFPHQQLNFVPLPPGTDVREYAETLVGRLGEREKAHVDLDRLSVLVRIHEHFGKHKSYFAWGEKTGKEMVDEETGTTVDEDYIVLVMQDLNEFGSTIGEHALAISPIAGKHAAYFTRHDASAGTWREILPLPKQEARSYGARGLPFTAATGQSRHDMMVEKIKALLECNPDDFHGELRMRGDGTYRIKNTERDMGKRASRFVVTV